MKFMSQKTLFEILSKSLGLYLIVQAAISIKEIIFYAVGLRIYGSVDNPDTYFYVGQNVFDLTCYLAGAFFLISKSELISNWLVKNRGDQITMTSSYEELIEIVVIAISLVMVLNSIPEIIGKITQYIYLNEYDDEDQNFFWEAKGKKADIISSFLKLAVGFIAITNANLITRRLKKTRDDNV